MKKINTNWIGTEKVGNAVVNPRGIAKVLSIVIPVWNKWNFTNACLNDLSKLPSDHEIILVDNGSTDETEAEMTKSNRIPGLIYHRLPTNLGFAKACNIGYGLAHAPNVLFLNNDIRVKSNYDNWTAELIKWSGGTSPRLVGPTMGELDDNLNFKREANGMLIGKNTYMSGWCLCASKETWEKLRIPRKLVGKESAPGIFTLSANEIYKEPTVDGQSSASIPLEPPQIFSEEFGLAYFEDTDLGFRANKLKIDREVVTIPVVHFGKQTSVQLNTHKLYTEARQIFVKKWGKK
jgi:glycosyltransferase involved in cell wall biosynthesis